jgi:cold shock protein
MSSKNPETIQGKVKWFNEQKGYGFIEQPDGRDLFVHYKECRGKLMQGDLVEYILGEGKKGPCATKVRLIKRAEDQPSSDRT